VKNFLTDNNREGERERETYNTVSVGDEWSMKETPNAMASETAVEVEAYKKKVENLTVLVRHYQTQLESHQLRRDGVETVSRLLAEARQENLILRQNQAALEMTVKNLQNRLATSGLVGMLGQEEDEVVVPGTSKQTLINLALENKRLRSMLQQGPESQEAEHGDGQGKTTQVCATSFLYSTCRFNKRKLVYRTLAIFLP
jgi:hypothetical protein